MFPCQTADNFVFRCHHACSIVWGTEQSLSQYVLNNGCSIWTKKRRKAQGFCKAWHAAEAYQYPLNEIRSANSTEKKSLGQVTWEEFYSSPSICLIITTIQSIQWWSTSKSMTLPDFILLFLAIQGWDNNFCSRIHVLSGKVMRTQWNRLIYIETMHYFG